MWNTFWNSTFTPASHVESDIMPPSEAKSGIPSAVHYREKRSEILSPEPSIRDRDSIVSRNFPIPVSKFSFKLRDTTSSNGKIYRFSSSINSLAELYQNICTKTGYQSDYKSDDNLDFITHAGVHARLCYLDDEHDVVSLESDKDLQEAVQMCLTLSSTRLVIYLGDPPSQLQQFESRPSSRASRKGSPFRADDQTPVPLNTPLTVIEALKDAPLVVNVAASAGICIIAFYIMVKISKM